MEIRITPFQVGGSIAAINSKSHAHRLLICAALSGGSSFIGCESSSDDIDATSRCLCALGASIAKAEGGYKVTGTSQGGKDALLDCAESGSTLRFLIPVAAALGTNSKFYMAGRLPSRPLTPLISQLEKHGCRLKYEKDNILCCTGKLTSGVFDIPGNVSSQYISGLIFALPILEGDSVINIGGKLESAGYVKMTIDAVSLAGIKVIREEGRIIIPGGQKYSLPGKTNAEGDWSNAAFWLTMGALSDNPVTCTGLSHSSSQLDKRIVRLLRRFGASVSTTSDSATVKKAPLHGIEINAADIPDIVPELALLAASAEGITKITHAHRLRMKECDRLHAVTEIINGLGGKVREYDDKLIIEGTGRLSGGIADSCSDHRMAMAIACASVICDGEVTVKNAEAVKKSYPAFWEDFKSLGGVFTRRDD